MTNQVQKSQLERFRDKGAQVRAFVEEHKRFPSTKSRDEAERLIGNWWSRKVTLLRRNELKDEYRQIISEIASIPGVSIPVPYSWTERYEQLQEFFETHDRLPKSGRPEEQSLATWVIQQRMNLKAGNLKPERRKELEKIPGALETIKVLSTDERLEQAREWCETHGHLPRANPSPDLPLKGEFRVEAGIANWMRNHVRDNNLKVESPEVIERREAIKELFAKYPTRLQWKAGVRV